MDFSSASPGASRLDRYWSNPNRHFQNKGSVEREAAADLQRSI
jgi:hypothetical protein